MLLVPGHGWNVLGWNHAARWLAEPGGLEGTHRYVTHHYFDSQSNGNGEGEGVYQTADKRYDDALAYAISQGFSDDADDTAPIISGLSITADSPHPGHHRLDDRRGRGLPGGVRIDTGLPDPEVYGSSTVRESNLLTSHSVTLTGLTPGEDYLIRVHSRDAAGNAAVPATDSVQHDHPGGSGGDADRRRFARQAHGPLPGGGAHQRRNRPEADQPDGHRGRSP